MRALTEIAAAGWPLAASLAVALFGQVRGARRRNALNEALHELRRPLQAMLLARPAAPGTAAALVLAALTRLDREINREPNPADLALIAPRSVLEQAAERWAPPAARAGGGVELIWDAGSARVVADPAELERSVDNLLANAFEHGSPPVRLEATARGGRIRLAVVDAGRAARPRPAVGRTGRRGHGLRIVRRFAARAGGRFLLERRPEGTVAVLELPIVTGNGGRQAA